MDQELLAPWAAPHMREGVFRKWLGVLLISCGLIVIFSYALTSYLMVRRYHPADLSKGSPAQPASPSARALIAAARKELNEGQVEQALVNFREALSLNPESIGAQLGLAEGEYAAGREEVAAKEFGRALQLDNQNRSALLALARIHSHHANTWPRAALDYRNYLKQNPGDADARLELARVLVWQGKTAEAATLFERSDVARLMTDADLRDYAFALIKMRRDARAVAVLRTLLAKRPGDSELSLQLVDIYAAQRNWSAALPIYRDLLAKRPGDPSLNLRYGLSLVASGHYQTALGPLERARAAMPTNGEAGLAYARAMKGTGDLKRALKEYEKILPQFARDTSIVREYADVLLEEKDYEKSARYYGVAYRQGLQDDRLLEGYAGSLSGAGKYKEALPYLERLYRRNPKPRVALELARVLAWQGRAAEAATLFERSDVTPLMTDADRRDYVFALAATRNWGAALPIYRDLLAKRPGDPSLNLRYGLSLVASGHYQAALGPLERARTAMPTNGEAGLAYARAMKGTGDLRRALKEYEKVLPQFARDTSIVREYADVLLEEKDYQESARYYGVAYRQGLQDDRLLEGYAGSLSGAGKYKEALPYLERLYRRNPKPRVALELARVLAWQGRAAEAATLFERSDVTPLMTDADRRDYVFALAATRNWGAALPIYRDLLAKRPGDPSLNLSYGLSLLASGHYQAALEPLDKARTALPTNGEAGLAYARAMKGTGDLKNAVKEYEKVLPRFEGDTSVVREYADALLEEKDYQKSAQYYGVAYSQGLQDDRLLAGYADSLNGVGKYKEALPYLEELYGRNRPGDPSISLSYGLDLLAAGHYQAALGPLDKARTALPTNREAGLAYARAMKGTGNLKRAVKEYERVLPRFEGDTSVVREYADVLLEEKAYQKSARYYGIAYSQGLRDDRLLAGYAGSLNGAGKYKEALPYLEELYRRNPTPRVTLELAKLLHRLGRNDRAKELVSQLETASPQLARPPEF